MLLRRLLPDAMWLSGGSIASISDFWSAIIDELGLYTSESETDGMQEAVDRAWSSGGGMGSIAREDRSASESFLKRASEAAEVANGRQR